MKTLWRKFLAWLGIGIQQDKPTPAQSYRVVSPPDYLFLKDGNNELPLDPLDIRFLVRNGGDWKFFGLYAVKHGLYTLDANGVTMKDEALPDGLTLRVVGHRQKKEASQMIESKTAELRQTHRCYWEVVEKI